MEQQGDEQRRVLDSNQRMGHAASQTLQVAGPHDVPRGADGKFDDAFEALHREFADNAMLGLSLGWFVSWTYNVSQGSGVGWVLKSFLSIKMQGKV